MIFELITGDFLFNPRPGNNHKKNDDHLALFMEMLGPMPKKFAMQGNMFNHYYMKDPTTGTYYFRRIHDLKLIKLEEILIYRYFFKPKEAHMFADFLMKILKWYPSERPTAQEMLDHPWLSMPDEFDYRMSDMEYKLYELKDQATQQDNFEPHLNHLVENKANIMDPNKSHHLTLDIDQIDKYIKKKAASAGNMPYTYPGKLVDSDDEYNAGDVEDNLD